MYYNRGISKKMRKIHSHEYGLPDTVSACQLHTQPTCANEKMPVIVSELAGELAVLKRFPLNFDALIAMKQAQLRSCLLFMRTTTDI